MSLQIIFDNQTYQAVYSDIEPEPEPTPVGFTIFDGQTVGTFNIEIPESRNYDIIIVGGGSGSASTRIDHFSGSVFTSSAVGGSGGLITGTTYIEKGTYTVIVGNGTNSAYTWGSTDYYIQADSSEAGLSSFNGNIAYGGGGAWAGCSPWVTNHGDGAGGTCTVVSEGLTGSDGTSGGSARYENYGKAGGGNGTQGYVKIVTA